MATDLQRASMWKRISAGLLDLILLVILVTGFMWLISIIDHYNKYEDEYNGYIASYEKEYNTSFSYSEAEYNALSDDDRARYDSAYQAFISDDTVLYVYNMVVNLTLVNFTLSILFSFLILEFLVPLLFKNGQTVGKKVFSLGVMRTDGVRLTTLQLVVRTLLGKFTVETMIPVLLIIMIVFGTVGLVGTLVVAAIFIINIVLMVATRTNSCIHDIFAVTVVIDLPSQMIFDTEADLIHYKEKLAAEKAESTTY